MNLFSLEELSQQLRNKRKKMDLEQQKLAELAGMSPSQVNRIEKNNVNPSYKSVYQLWNILENIEHSNAKTAKDVMADPIMWINTEDTLEDASKIMREKNISQLPVNNSRESKSPINTGRITERRIMDARDPDMKVEEVMGTKFPEVTVSTGLNILTEILKHESAVIVNDRSGEYTGIVTRADLI
jgi:predicted transcriptional regulator